MSLLVRDLLLSGLVYVILTFRLMRKRRNTGGDGDGGQPFQLSPPKIDLPPGVDWPVNDGEIKKEREELLV